MNNQQYLLSFIRDLEIKIDKRLDYNFHIEVISGKDYYRFLDFEEKGLDGTIAIGGIVAKVVFDVFSTDGANILCLDFYRVLPLGKLSTDQTQFDKSLNSKNAKIYKF